MKHKASYFMVLILLCGFCVGISAKDSVRNYSDKKVILKDVVKIMDVGRLGPAAGNIHTLKFILVEDKDKKEEVAHAAHEQHFIEKASYVIVVCSDTKQMVRSYGERGKMYAKYQAGAAIENMLLKATDLGLGSCWIGAFDEEDIKKILKIPDEIDIEALLPIGYSASKKVERPRVQLHTIVHKGTFNKSRSFGKVSLGTSETE